MADELTQKKAELVDAIRDLATEVEKILVQQKMAVRLQIATSVMLLCCGIAIAYSTSQIARVGTQVETTEHELQELADQAARTKQVVDDTKHEVGEVKAQGEETPKIEVRPGPSSNGKQGAVVVIRAPKPRPTASAAAPPAASTPNIEIPVKLPEGSKIQKE